ncbi:uncharacterized protein [Apostichopus japonicus]|uniref:uncharacterized protein n=1 Tax=Stichopus japonicus TaxID=307972 RepID=UPI003AB42202
MTSYKIKQTSAGHSCLLVLFVLTMTSPTSVSSGSQLPRLYLIAKSLFFQIKEATCQLRSNITRTRNVHEVILRSEIKPISGIEEIVEGVGFFNQEQIDEIPRLLLKHLEYLNVYQELLRLFRQDEEDGITDDAIYTHERQVERIRSKISLLKTKFHLMIQILGHTFDPASVPQVTFDTCDEDITICVSKRGVYILQEFEYYIRLARENLADLLAN